MATLRGFLKGLSNIIPARDGKKSMQNGDMDKPVNLTDDDGFIKNLESSPQRSRERHSREPHRQTYDPQRHAYDPHRRNQDRNRQPMYDSRRPTRDVSPQGRRSRQDGYNGSYERNGRYGDSYGYSRDYVPGKPPPGSPRRSRSNQSPTRSYSPSRVYSPQRSHSPTRNQSPTRARSPSPDRVHNHPYVSEGSREVTINSAAKREEVEFHFDEKGQRVTTGHTVIAVTAYHAGQPDGPPKPPRRQQSLNRIHIPEGPDYDPTSASDSPHSSPKTSKQPDIQASQKEPEYANYSSSGYSHQSGITYTERSQSVNVISAKAPQLQRQRSFPETHSWYQDNPPTFADVEKYRAKDNPPTFADVEEYRAKAAVSEHTERRQKAIHVKARRNIDTSNRMYRSESELNAAHSEPEMDWSKRPQLHHSDSLRTDPGRYNTADRPHRRTHLKHTDSLRSAPGGYSYGSSWKDEPSWKRDPRERYLQEQHGYHNSLERPSRRDHIPRSQRPASVPFPDQYDGGNDGGSYNPQQYQPDKYDQRSRMPDYANKSSRPMEYNQQGHDSNGWQHGKRSTSSSKQGYSSDSGVSSFRHPSEGEQVDPVYENTNPRQDDPLYAVDSSDYPKERNGFWERDGGEYVIKGPHEMAVDVPSEMLQQQTSAPLMAHPPGTQEGSRAGLHTVPRDEIQDVPSSSTQDPKWAEHLARREQRREVLRTSSQDSLMSNESDQNQKENRHPQRGHTTEVPLSLATESAIKPQQANTQESGYSDEMPKRQRQNGRAPSQGPTQGPLQGEYVPNSMYHVPYSDPNAPYAPKRPYDPYNPYHYGPYGEVPRRMNYSPVHSAPPYKGYPDYGHPMSPVDPRYGAQSPTRGMPYGPGHPSGNQQMPGNQSPTLPREADGWMNRPYMEGAPHRWPGPDPRYRPLGFVQEPYMPYNQARETYSANYTMPPYMQQGGYYQPPIPSPMFYGSHYPEEVAPAPRSVPPQMSTAQRSRSVDALELRASVQQEVQTSPRTSPSASLSPERSLSPDEKNKRLQDLRQRVKSYMPGEDKKQRSQSFGSPEPTREEVISPTKADVAHTANVPVESDIPFKSHATSEFKPIEQTETATSIGAKLFLKKKKEAVIGDLKKKIIKDRQYGSEPELTSEREVPSKSSSARPLRVSGSSGNDATDSNRQSRRKADKAAEVALNELEQMYAMLDQETEDLLLTGECEPQYDRLTELKLRARQRLEELKLEREMEEQGLTPPSQRGKRRPRRERAKSDITESYRSLTQSDEERQQQFFPYRTSQHPDNLNLDNQSYKPPKDPQAMQFIKRNSDSSSDEEEEEVRRPQSNIYRAPRSEDYLGYSSDSSPSPERRMRNSKRKPVAQPRKTVNDGEEPVLPEYVKKSMANSEHTTPKSGYDSDKSGKSSIAERRREFFLSSPSPSPDIVVDLNRPVSPKKELNIAVSEITLVSSSKTTLQSSRTTLRSVSPLARNYSPLSKPDPSKSRARSVSPSSYSKEEKEKSPRGKAMQEPMVVSVSQRPVEQSPPKRPVPAPRKSVPLLTVPAVENQPPGTRMSVSSVSTIDSTGLSQPFEEMGREYGVLVSEHYPYHISERSLSRHSSSIDSLVQTVTDMPKTMRKETLSPRPPTPPSQPPPDTDTEKSSDESQRKKTGGIWALLGPKVEPPKVSTANKTAPLPSPEPTLTSDSESEGYEVPTSTDESFQTPRSSTLSPPPQMEPQLTFEMEEPVQAIKVTAPELPPDLFKLPLESNIPYMDSDGESSYVGASRDGSEPGQQRHNDIPFMDSSDESEAEDVKRRREPVRGHQEQLRGPNASAPLAYDENDLEIPDPAQFAKVSSSQSKRSSRKKDKQQQDFQADQEVAVINREQEHSVNIISPLSADDLPQNNNNMTSTARQPKTERRRNFLSSSGSGRSHKNFDTDSGGGGGAWQSRFTKDRSSSPLTRSGSSTADYSSYSRPSVTDHHRSSPRTSSESYSRRTPDTGSTYTPSSSAAAAASRQRRHERSDSGSKYSVDHHHKRAGTESGYGSLERDKNKRTGKTATSSSPRPALADIDSINYIRDKYLGGKTTNGDVDRTVHSPTTRTHSDFTTRTGSMATTGGSRLTHQNSLPSGSDSEDPESRAARIARYKEQRRKELAQKYGLGTSMIPSSSDSDYAARKYRYSRQSSLKSDGEESDRSSRSVDERTDRYRKYSRDADVSRSSPAPTASRIGSERDAGISRGRPSSSHNLSRHRSVTEPVQPLVVSTKRDRSVSASTVPSENKLARKDSIISQETQLLIENLEASRAARRERLRRSESEAKDDADRIIAKHRARYASDSDREVFSPSPSRKAAPESLDRSPRSPSPRTSLSTPPVERRTHSTTSRESADKARSSTDRRRRAADTAAESQTKTAMPERKSRSSEGSESGETSDPHHHRTSSARNRRNRRMNVSVSVEELKEAHKLQGTKSPVSDTPGDDVFSPISPSSFQATEQFPTPVPVIAEEATINQSIKPAHVSGMGGNVSTPIIAEESRSQRTSKPTAKVEPVKKTVADDSHNADEREKRRSRRRVEQSDSIKRPGSPTKQHSSQRPKSPTKDVRRPSSPTKDVRRPSSPTKGVLERKPSEQRIQRATVSTYIEEPKSPSKVRHQKPEIPQVLKQARARSNSTESNSSAASEGRRSPSRRVARVSSKDSIDSRGSPTGSPKHKAVFKEPSARLLELSKPRRTTTPDAVKKDSTKPSDRKPPFGKTISASPKKQQKVRLSKEAEKRLKASKKTEIVVLPTPAQRPKAEERYVSEEEIQSVTVSTEKHKSVVQTQIVASTVAVEEQTPKPIDKQDDERSDSTVDDKDDDYKTPPMEIPNDGIDSDISPVSSSMQSPVKERASSKSSEPEEIRKQALAKKDSDLFAKMKARAEKLEKELEETERMKQLAKESESDEETSDVSAADLRPELPVPVTHRMRAFQIPKGTKPPKSRTKSTESPTGSPTRSPTRSQTKSPTMSPTRSPTRSPTKSPRSPRSPRSPAGSTVSSPSRSPAKQATSEQLQILPDTPSSPAKTPNDTEEEEDQLSKLSVSEKMRMFTHLQKKRAKEQAAIKPKHRQYRRVRSSDRSQTQPVTPEELSEASHIAKEMAEKAKSSSQERMQEIIEEEKEDELSKLSLAEKMKLFHEKAETKVEPLPKMEVPRRKKRSESRYKTQPITIEEVKKAAKFSPLARSFAAPPDPRILATMPIADQISLVFGDNEENVPARKSSITEHAQLGRRDSEPNVDKRSILKQSSVETVSTASASILKTETTEQKQYDSHSILKSKEVNQIANNVGIKADRVRGILKESSTESEDAPGILRRDVSPESFKEPDSILKKDTVIEKPTASPGILRRGMEAAPKEHPKRGILRKEDSADADVDSGTDEQLKRRKGTSALSSSERPRPRREKAGIKIVDQSESESDAEPRVRARSSLVSSKDSNIAAKAAANKRKSARFSGAPTERYKTQPISSPTKTPLSRQGQAPAAGSPRYLKTPISRRQTQPVTPEEMASVKQLMEPVKTTSSIAERLNALQRNGEENWKNRIEKYEDSPTSGPTDKICMLNNNHKNGGTPSSISDRLKLLQTNAEHSWKSRVEEKDVSQFTVEGKMKKGGKEVTRTDSTPVTIKRSGSFKSRPRGGSFRKRVNLEDKKEDEDKSTSSKSEESPAPIKLDGFTTTTTDTSTTDTSESEPDFKIIQKKIAIMKPDDDKFSEFFSSKSTSGVSQLVKHTMTEKSSSKTTVAEFEMSVSDFDAITEITKPRLLALSAHRRSLRPQRRVRPSTNPMKALKLHQAVLGEYTEVKMELTEVETKVDKKKDTKRTDTSRKNGLSSSAKKGLASKEDLKHGIQKLVKPKDVRQMKSLSDLLPYKDIMLIQIKGRRFVQVRLVEPRARSLNSGDCFVLVTPAQLFLWIGEYANVIEKSKASDIAKHIQTKRDLGCKASEIISVEEPRAESGMKPSRNWKKFMKVLEVEEDYTDVGGPDEDEMHEIYITDTNMVYKMDGESLVPYDDYWGAPPKHDMLNTKEILVFDFGSELYIWNGKQTSKEQRKMAVKLAQVIWERGYDYTEYDVNPVCPGNKCPKSMQAEERPEWALFCKANQHMETILFSSKFIDWPDDSKIIKTKRTQDGQDKESKTEAAPELVAFDAKLMIQPSLERPHLVLEGTNLGRGTGMAEVPNATSNGTIAHFDKIERRGNHITTLSVVVWHILEYEHSVMPNECFAQFHEGDTYVVRWQYRVESIGMRDLKGNLSKRGLGHGRERCAYFFWQGAQSTINEKGASALMTVELDDERGPQRQVIQGKEPAAFLHLFQGRMVMHVGKREEEDTNTKGPYRLYCVRGEHTTEGFLLEVPCAMNQLRSRACFVLLDLKNVDAGKATICVWHGAKASPATREVVSHCANMMLQHKPMEAGLNSECNVTLEEMEEGKENHTFRQTFGEDRAVYDSALEDPLEYNYTPRLFHLSSASGMFLANEVLNTYRSEEHLVPYPFFQSDIYNVHQPAQFLFDNHYEVYLWQGWWPAENAETEGSQETGSARRRWDIERRCAMETVMAYCSEKRIRNSPKAYLVHAGLEPLTFVNLFPFWHHRKDVAELQKQEGKQGTRAVLVKDVLERLTKARFSFEELKERPLPDGVDPLKLEHYLEDEEFEEVLEMKRNEFYELPNWKQIDMKKRASLF